MTQPSGVIGPSGTSMPDLPIGGAWIGDRYCVAGSLDVLAIYRDGKLIEIEVDGKLFVPALTGTLRCSDCKHTMSQDEWGAHLYAETRNKDEYVEMDWDGVCPMCGKGVMEEVA